MGDLGIAGSPSAGAGSPRDELALTSHSHGDALWAALLPGLLIVMVLGASACGDAGKTDAPKRSSTAGQGATRSATASPTSSTHALRPGPPRTTAAVVEHFVGRRVKLGGRTIQIDADTLTCGGLGRPTRRVNDQGAWTRFRCIQPTFPPGRLVGPDLIFVVQSVRPRDFAVARRYFTSY